ncbi:MAG: helix-turn-helix domain-containing protein [Mesorhizobium sp.]|nr:helix-turn-helix domain-containing protein [Mesorhizobium sp.]
MKKVSFAEMRCSLARSLDLIGDWWTPLIVRDVYLGVTRFDDIAEDLGISRNLLTRRLGHLCDKDVLRREAYQIRPARHDYLLTQSGLELVPVILALTAWGDRWVQPAEGQPIRFVHTTCGESLVPAVTCSSCGEAIHASDVLALPGPGGADGPGTKVLAGRLRGGQIAR